HPWNGHSRVPEGAPASCGRGERSADRPRTRRVSAWLTGECITDMVQNVKGKLACRSVGRSTATLRQRTRFFVINTLRGCLQKDSRRSPSPDLSSAAETTSQAALCLEALMIEQAKRARESPADVGHEHSAPPLAGAYRGEVAEQALPDQARRPAAGRIGHGLVAGPYHDTADTITARLDPHVDAVLRIRPDAQQPILSLRGRYRHR